MQKEDTPRQAYAIARLWNVRVGAEIVEYLDRIDATLEPFEGQFIIHGGHIERMEGAWPEGDLIVIRFPDRERLAAWYRSEQYAVIKRLRTDNAEGDVIFIEGSRGPTAQRMCWPA